MAMPLEITKSLVQRIIPELPFEEDIIYSRSYVELLSNIVQTDRTCNVTAIAILTEKQVTCC
jgi:hypothetical protein